MALARILPIVCGVAVTLSWLPHATAEDIAATAELKLFRERIEPVLKEHCYACHAAGAKELKGGLRLDSRAAARRGGDTGAAVVPGKPAESIWLKAIKHQDGL